MSVEIFIVISYNIPLIFIMEICLKTHQLFFIPFLWSTHIYSERGTMLGKAYVEAWWNLMEAW
jgi:hypothetical protein